VDASVIENLADPAILFFFLGAFVGTVRSNLEIPSPIAKPRSTVGTVRFSV
jgi:uncharacterized protein